MAANSIGNASLILSTQGSKLSQGLTGAQSDIQQFANKANNSFKGLGTNATTNIKSGVSSGISSLVSLLFAGLRAGPYAAIAAGAVAVGATIWEAISKPFDKLKELGGLQRQSDVLGISASQLQGTTLLLERFGIEGEQVNGIFARMGKNVFDAAGGHGKAAPALKQLGIQAQELSKLPVDEQFKEIANAVSKLPPGAAQASAALHIFGEAGAQLIPILQKGGEGIQEFIDHEKKVGAVLSDGQIKAAADAQKAWRESKLQISATWEGLINRATLIAAPVIKIFGSTISKGFSLLTPLFDWLGRGIERVSIILEQVGDVLSGWIDEGIAEIRNLGKEVGIFTDGWPTVEQVVSAVLKEVAQGFGLVWDALKAGTGAGSYVIGFLVKGFSLLVETFKGTIKDLLEIAGTLPDDLGGDWFRRQAKNVDKLGTSIFAAGDSMMKWGKDQINAFGSSATTIGAWFDKLKLKRDEVKKKVVAEIDVNLPDYKSIASVLKDSKEDFSILAKFNYDQKVGKDKQDKQEKQLEEQKKTNDLITKLIGIFGNPLVLGAG